MGAIQLQNKQLKFMHQVKPLQYIRLKSPHYNNSNNNNPFIVERI